MEEILTTNSIIMCPHGGRAILLTPNMRVSTNDSFWLLETDVHPIVGCPLARGNLNSPCIRIEWSSGSTRTTINGTPVLKRESKGMCYNSNNDLQGTAIIVLSQIRVETQRRMFTATHQ